MRRAALPPALLPAGCYRLTKHRTVGSAEAWIRVRA
jgi:hypothetical protein